MSRVIHRELREVTYIFYPKEADSPAPMTKLGGRRNRWICEDRHAALRERTRELQLELRRIEYTLLFVD